MRLKGVSLAYWPTTIFFQLHVLPPEWLAVEFTHFCGFFGLDHLIFIRHLYFLIFVHKFAFFIALKYSLKSPGMAALISSHVNCLVQPFPRDPGGRCCPARYFYPIKYTKCSIKYRSMNSKKITFVTKYIEKRPIYIRFLYYQCSSTVFNHFSTP